MLARVLLNLAVLLKNQWLPPRRLRALQNRKLRALLQHAYDNVPYHRRLFDEAGLKPEDIPTVDELHRLPMTSKQDLQQKPVADFLSRNVDPADCRAIQTTGSTGIPLEVYLTRRELDMRVAAEMRMLLACLDHIFPRVVRVTSRPFAEPGGLLRILTSRIKRANPLESTDSIVDCIRRFRPHVLLGYPTALQLIARSLVEKGVASTSVATVISGGEVLEPAVRREMAHVFQGQIFDTYGALELGRLGWECRKHAGLHLCADAYVFEIVRDGRRAAAGETGEVVVTSLEARAMPIIRYRLGDLCAISGESCPCGRGLPLVKAVEGRHDDMLVLPEGRLLAGPSALLPIHELLNSLSGVRQFRVVQDRRDHITVEIVRGAGFPPDGAEQICDAYHGYYPGLGTEVRFVSDIPRDPSGKMRKMVSLIGQ